MAALTTSHALCSKCRPKPRFRSVELTKFGVAEKHTVDVFVHLFQDDLFVAEPFTEEDTTLVPADVSTVVHPSRSERFGTPKAHYPAEEHSSAGHVTRATGRSTLGTPCRSHSKESTQEILPTVAFDRIEHEIG